MGYDSPRRSLQSTIHSPASEGGRYNCTLANLVQEVAQSSASRTEPPGWIKALAPALAASSTPSGNGKNASEATTLPSSEDCAFITAILTESTRLICPAPTPSVAPSFAKTIALDLTCLQTFQANFIVDISSAVGWRLVTIFN